MKTQITKSIIACLLAGSSLWTIGCQKEDIPVESLTENTAHSAVRQAQPYPDFSLTKFSADKFASNIETAMNNNFNSAAYGYAIYNEGQLYYKGIGGNGWARKPVDAPSLLHGALVRQDIGSVDKFVTALAAIVLLDRYGLTLSEPVYKYLPSNWHPSTNFKKLTFERLLAQRTGLINNGEEWDDLEKTVEGPMDLTKFNNNSYEYNNINFVLMGIILSYLQEKKEVVVFPNSTPPLQSLEGFSEAIYNETGYRYRKIVQNYVLKPAGLQYWNLIDFVVWDNSGPIDANLGTKAYKYGNLETPGVNKLDARRTGASGGMYISAAEFGQIQAAAAQGKIITAARYQAMKDKRLGLDGVVDGNHGKYYWKNGSYNNFQAMIFDYGKVQAAVFANSPNSGITDPALLTSAYEKAWLPVNQ